MRIKDVPNLLDYLPDNVNPEADINDLCIEDTKKYGKETYATTTPPIITYTPLTWAVSRKLSGVIKLLIQNEVDLNKPDSYGRTPLVVSRWDKVIQRQLLDAGAKLSSVSADNQTAFDDIINGGASDITLVTLDRAIKNVPISADLAHTPLLSAIHHRAFVPQQKAVEAIMKGSLSQEGSYLSKVTAEIIERYADFGEKFSSYWEQFPKWVKAEIALHAKTAALAEAEYAKKAAEKEANTKSSQITYAYMQRIQPQSSNPNLALNAASTVSTARNAASVSPTWSATLFSPTWTAAAYEVTPAEAEELFRDWVHQ